MRIYAPCCLDVLLHCKLVLGSVGHTMYLNPVVGVFLRFNVRVWQVRREQRGETIHCQIQSIVNVVLLSRYHCHVFMLPMHTHTQFTTSTQQLHADCTTSQIFTLSLYLMLPLKVKFGTQLTTWPPEVKPDNILSTASCSCYCTVRMCVN